MSGNEISRRSSNDVFVKNSVVVKSNTMSFEDFYFIHIQYDIFDSNSHIIGNQMTEEYDASRIFRKDADGSFVFIGWAEPLNVNYNH